METKTAGWNGPMLVLFQAQWEARGNAAGVNQSMGFSHALSRPRY